MTGATCCGAGDGSGLADEFTVTGAREFTGSVTVNCGCAVGGVLLPLIFHVNPRIAKIARAAI
ncbi:hypothetical protein AO402_20690 [Salmonella enterica]|nr:hypothetical protein [Salmonella enterica]